MKNKIRALIFDMDGLIFDSEKIVQRAWDIVGTELGFGKVGEHIYHTVGLNVDGRREYFKKALSSDFPFDEFSACTRIVFREIADREGVAMKPGAKELIMLAHAKGYRLAVATSSRRAHATRLLQDAEIYDYFDGIVFGDMVSHSKPHPEIYQKACEQIGVLPEEGIAFEDAPSGVRSAAAAGLKVVIVPDLVEPPEEVRRLAWKQVKSLEEIKEIMENCGVGL